METEAEHVKAAGRSRWLTRKRILLLIVLGMVGWFMLLQPVTRKWALVRACSGADQVNVVLLTPPGQGSRQFGRIVVPIKGENAVSEFLEFIRLRPSIPGLDVLCDTTTHVEVIKSDQVVAKLHFPVMGLVRWVNGKWFGVGSIGEPRDRALRAWMERRGGVELKEAQTLADRLWKEYRMRRDEEKPGAQEQHTQAASQPE